MKRVTIAVASFVALTIFACDDEAAQAPQPELRTEAPCSEGVPEYDVVVERRLSEIGPAANELLATDDALFIVESAANTVSRFDRLDGSLKSGFVDVGNDRNPYAASVDEEAGEIWVTNFISDTVTVADLVTGEVLEEISDERLVDPSAVALTDGYAYVANVEFLSLDKGYGPGSIAVIERSTLEVVAAWETAFQNPHFLAVYDVDGAESLFVSGAGTLDMSGEDVRVGSEGGLQWLDLDTDPVEPPSQSFSLGQASIEAVGAPGRPLLPPGGERLYFSSGIAPVLFVFDLEERQWIYDAVEPLQLYESENDVTHRAAMGANGLLWITSFNDDELYLLDTACDELVAPPIDVGEVADMLEGAQALTIVTDGESQRAYYLLSIANAIGRVTLEP